MKDATMENKQKEMLNMIDAIDELYNKSIKAKVLPITCSKEQFIVLMVWLLYKDDTVTDIIQSKYNKIPVKRIFLISTVIGFLVSIILSLIILFLIYIL